MYVAELTFRKLRASPAEAADAIDTVLAFLLNNGQVLGWESPTAETRTGYSTRVVLPERDSLHPRFHNRFARKALRDLRAHGLAGPRVRIVGREPSGPSADGCKRPRWRVLYTQYISVAPPVRCGDCFDPVPLYRVPERSTFLRENVLFWSRAWQACDRLQMGCRVGERFTTDQISNPESDLGRWGWDLCDRLRRQTRIPTYLYLYRYGAKDRKREVQRCCPICGGAWRLEERLHRLFDFKCDRCRLVSNIAWSVR
jgi:predicted  nucleic acid-binding Zn ribbon protein